MDDPDFMELHYLATSAGWRADRYYTYDLMTELIQGWIADYSGLATCESVGTSAI